MCGNYASEVGKPNPCNFSHNWFFMWGKNCTYYIPAFQSLAKGTPPLQKIKMFMCRPTFKPVVKPHHYLTKILSLYESFCLRLALCHLGPTDFWQNLLTSLWRSWWKKWGNSLRTTLQDLLTLQCAAISTLHRNCNPKRHSRSGPRKGWKDHMFSRVGNTLASLDYYGYQWW